METENCLLIIDELKGRTIANHFGLRTTGTLGILVEAKLSGMIPSIKPVLQKIKASNFRMTPHLEELMLRKAGEL